MNTHPRQQSGLCAAFQLAAARTWYRIRDNHTMPILLREDGITALNLQDLCRFDSQEFTVIDFSPYVESRRTGADWEWWFMQPNLHFGAAVQAKSLSRKQDYDIAYTPRKRIPQVKQIHRLLTYSKSNHLTPMYCFYNWWAKPPAQHWPCKSFIEHKKLWGCALADGYNVWRLHLLKKHSLADLHTYMMPWHCIACCPGYVEGGPEGPATRALGIARVMRQHDIDSDTREAPQDEDIYPDFPEPKLVAKLPERISVLRDHVRKGKDIDRDLIGRLFGETPPKQVILQGKPETE